MSNRVFIVPTKFINVRNEKVTFGVRIWDNHNESMIDDWLSVPASDLDVLRKVVFDSHDNEEIAFIEEAETGCYISDVWYTWEEIKHIFE